MTNDAGVERLERRSATCGSEVVAQHRASAHPLPLRRAADILSRVRSPISSRSNWANDSRMLSVSLPNDMLVLNCCVTGHKTDVVFLEHAQHAGEGE